jgi:hypothetical protein
MHAHETILGAFLLIFCSFDTTSLAIENFSAANEGCASIQKPTVTGSLILEGAFSIITSLGARIRIDVIRLIYSSAFAL